jgi:branched-chain amino acid transport system substrate-binding protein
MKRRTLLSLAPAGLLLGVAGCDSTSDEGGDTTSLPVGFDVHSTGPSGQFGVTVQRSAELTNGEIAGAGGATLELHFEDNQLNPQLALTVFQKLIDVHKTPVVLSGGTAPVMAIAGAAKDRKILVVNVAAVSPVLKTAAPWVINLVPTADKEGVVLADYIYKTIGYKSLAAINVNNDFGNESMKSFEESYTKLGGKLLRQEKSQSGATDFRPQLLRLQQVNPEGIVIMANQGENGHIVSQSVQLGFRQDQLFGTSYMLTSDNFTAAGATMNGVRGVAFRFDPTKTDMARAFVAAFKAKYNADPDIQAATVSTSLRLIDDAVRKGARTGEQLRKEIVGVKDFASVFGPLNFDDSGTVQLPIERWEIKDQKPAFAAG